MAGIYKPPRRPSRPAGFRNFRAPSSIRKPIIRKPVVKKKPPGRIDTTKGLKPYTGYEGPGVQDFIDQGKIPYDQGMGRLGYTPPKISSSGPGGPSSPSYNYSADISGDWEVQDAEAAMAAAMARARAEYRADLRRAFIELGLSDVSKLGKEYAGEIDAETIKQAAANKYSLMAQVAQAAEKSRAGNNAALAARGILSSGQTTKSQTDVSAGAEQSRYQGLQEFLSGALTGKRSLADLAFQLARAVAAARANAANRAGDRGDGGGGGGNYPFWEVDDQLQNYGGPPSNEWLPKNWTPKYKQKDIRPLAPKRNPIKKPIKKPPTRKKPR